MREFKILLFENWESNRGSWGILEFEYRDLEGSSRISKGFTNNIIPGLNDLEAEYWGPFGSMKEEKESRDIEGFRAITDEF